MKINPDYIIMYEAGQLTEKQIIQLFYDLGNSGEIWNLPTPYLNTYALLLEHNYFANLNGELQ